MKTEDQVMALAELDGFNNLSQEGPFKILCGYRIIEGDDVCRRVPYYHESYDAIIPLRVKVCTTAELKVRWLNYARSILARRIKLVSDFDISTIKPDEDCESLLRATNKWTE